MTAAAAAAAIIVRWRCDEGDFGEREMSWFSAEASLFALLCTLVLLQILFGSAADGPKVSLLYRSP